MSVIVKRPWTTQPQIPVSGIGCYGWVPANGANGALNPSVGVGGIKVAPTSAVIIGQAPPVTTTFTVILICTAPSASVGIAEVFRLGPTTTGVRLDAFTSGAGIYTQWTLNGVLNLAVNLQAVTFPLSTAPIFSMLSVKPGTAITLTTNVDGSNVLSGAVSTSDASTVIAPGDSNVIILTGSQTNYAVFVLPRFVDLEEAARIALNPWQLFAPLPRRIWAPDFGPPPPGPSDPVPYSTSTSTDNELIALGAPLGPYSWIKPRSWF